MSSCKKNGKAVIQDVMLSDRTTPIIQLKFIKSLGQTTLSADTSIDDTTVSLTDATGFVDGDHVGIFEPEGDRFYFGDQVGAAVGNDISIDTPLDFAFTSGKNVIRATHNMAVDGSVTTQIFEVQGTGNPDSDFQIDITRIILTMLGDNSPPPAGVGAFDASTFGNIVGGLTNGIVLRQVNGLTQNIFNAKTNQELSDVCYDVTIESAARVGQDGLSMRLTFAGQDKHGVAIRLRTGDSLEMWVQDDLTLLDVLTVTAEGHVVD